MIESDHEKVKTLSRKHNQILIEILLSISRIGTITKR